MLAPDVNVLVDAFRQDSPHHEGVSRWLRRLVEGPESFAVFEMVLSGFLRIVTHPRVFDPPATISDAFDFTNALLAQRGCVILRPGGRHWEIFQTLCRGADARGNLVPDAYLAALALEHGCTWVTSDRDFARFEPLRWELPEAD